MFPICCTLYLGMLPTLFTTTLFIHISPHYAIYSISSTLVYFGYASLYNPISPHTYPIKRSTFPLALPLSQAEAPLYRADGVLCCCGSWVGWPTGTGGPGVRAMATEQAEAARLRPAASTVLKHKFSVSLPEVPVRPCLQHSPIKGMGVKGICMGWNVFNGPHRG